MDVRQIKNRYCGWIMYLYIAVFPNNKKYIGISKNFSVRKRKHKFRAKRGDTEYFYNAVRKYGWNNIKWIVADGYNSWDDLCSIEIKEIEKYNTCCYNKNSYGYNMTKGGDGTVGFTHSDEYRKRLSEKWSGKNNPNKILPNSGEKHGMSKVTLKQVKEMRKKYKSGKYSYTDLGKIYNLYSGTVSRIVRKITWKKI